MNVISNASPLIFLSKLNELHLLDACFEETAIPTAVKQEVGDLLLPDFISIQSVSEVGQHYVAGALGSLHAGELEVMQLALETSADLVILDDRLAREKAKRRGLRVIGTLGVLQLAVKRQLLDEEQLISHYNALVNQHGMWLSKKLLAKLASH